jgi:hypothetical protein
VDDAPHDMTGNWTADVAARPRAPEVRIGYGPGLLIPHARHLRLRAEADGVVRLTRPGRPPEVLATPGQIVRAVWLSPRQATGLLPFGERILAPTQRVQIWWWRRRAPDPGPAADGGVPWRAAYGAVILFGQAGPVAAWFVGDVTPWAGDAAERRETSGSVALVRALGLVLERAEPGERIDARAARRVRLDSRHLPTVAAAGLSVGLIASFALALATLGHAGTITGAAVGLSSLLLGLPAIAVRARLRARLLGLVTHPPEPDGRAVFRPAYVTGADDPCQIQFGSHDVVVVNGAGIEHWIPGPELGGVTTCLVSEEDVHLQDRANRVLHVLSAPDLVTGEDDRRGLAQACRVAGIAVEHTPLPLATRNLPTRLRHRDELGFPASSDQYGNIVNHLVPVLSWLAVALHLPLAALAASRVPVVGVPYLVGALAWAGSTAWTDLSLRAWKRGVRRRAD